MCLNLRNTNEYEWMLQIRRTILKLLAVDLRNSHMPGVYAVRTSQINITLVYPAKATCMVSYYILLIIMLLNTLPHIKYKSNGQIWGLVNMTYEQLNISWTLQGWLCIVPAIEATRFLLNCSFHNTCHCQCWNDVVVDLDVTIMLWLLWLFVLY